MSKLLKLILFSIIIIFFWAYIKMDQENISFYQDYEGSFEMVDRYLYNRYFGIKILTIIMILMLIEYYYIKK